MKRQNRSMIVMLMGLAALGMAGCEKEDGRLAQMARDATRRQAEQNQEMVRLNRDVAESHKRLVEADGVARQEVLQIQRELNQLQRETQTAIREERNGLDRQHEKLEQERQQIAAQRHRDPIIAGVLTTLGVVLACLVPLGLAIYLLRAVRNEGPADTELAELLTEELVAERPVLLPPQAADHCMLDGPQADRPRLTVEAEGESGE